MLSQKVLKGFEMFKGLSTKSDNKLRKIIKTFLLKNLNSNFFSERLKPTKHKVLRKKNLSISALKIKTYYLLQKIPDFMLHFSYPLKNLIFVKKGIILKQGMILFKDSTVFNVCSCNIKPRSLFLILLL